MKIVVTTAVTESRSVAALRTSRAHPAPWFGPYLLVELLAEGGAGQVWCTIDARTNSRVALKRLLPSTTHDPRERARLAREAALLARINAAHVIAVHDQGDVDGHPYLAMPLAGGGDLQQLLSAHPAGLDLGLTITVVAQIADALTAIHAAGVAHRDIKPANVVFDHAPSTGAVSCRLIDLGIASPLHGPPELRLTPAGNRAGTPSYMAPELFDPHQPGGITSDVYALGVLAYQLLTGQAPFPGPGLAELAYQHHLMEPAVPSTRRPHLTAFDSVLARALAKNPAQRHPNPAALAADLTLAANLPSRSGQSADPSYSSTARRSIAACLSASVGRL